MSLHLRHKAIQFYHAGKVHAAHDLLRAAIKQDPRDELAWLWYAETCSTHDERRAVFESWLKADPDSRRAHAALGKLRAKPGVRHAEPGKPSFTRRRSGAPPVLVWVGILCLLLAAAFFAYTGTAFELNRQRIRNGTLQSERDRLQRDHLGLVADYQSLDFQYRGLATDYASLEGQHRTLLQEHNQLTTQYASLMGQYGALQQKHDQLTSEHQSLQAQYQALNQAYDNLTAEYVSLQSRAITPPYIYIYGRTVRIAFVRLDQEIEWWEVPFDSLEAEIKRGYWMRELHPQEIPTLNLTTNSGQDLRVMDFRPFVEGQLFSKVMPALYKRSGSDAAFIREAWNIVSQLTVYSDEIGETPRYPLETLLAGGGDCEDTAILFASMIKSAGLNWKVELVYMDSDHPQDPATSNHVLVHLKTDRGTSHLIETTSKDKMEWPIALTGWYFEVD